MLLEGAHGCESGDDEVLRRVGKGESRASSVDALRKLESAGLKTSVMILHGLGGRQPRLHQPVGAAARRLEPQLLVTAAAHVEQIPDAAWLSAAACLHLVSAHVEQQAVVRAATAGR